MANLLGSIMSEITSIKGRGAQKALGNKFAQFNYANHQDWSYENAEEKKTKLFFETPKVVVNKVTSPDVPLEYSINPYQGCEHGCVYCYARNSHEYWGFDAGLGFEQNIIVKQKAPDLLRKKFNSRGWKGAPIMLSGNTDCYQPQERKFKLTQALLKVCYEFKNPVGIITKNRLVLRDIEILKALASKYLVDVVLSINSTNELLIRKLEPRTSAYKQRIATIEILAKENIPVSVLISPIIPGLNAIDIPRILKDTANAGANNSGYTVVRLNGKVGVVFEDWIKKEYPKRANKVLNQIKELHGGNLNDSRFKTRMRGEGPWSKAINEQFKLFHKKYFPNPTEFKLNSSLFKNQFTEKQLSLEF